ncbi:MAG: hypothetical protein WD572_04550 [Gammaproteobacteria bacterium]
MSLRLFFVILIIIGAWQWWNRPGPVEVDMAPAGELPYSFARNLSVEKPPIQKKLDNPPGLNAGEFKLRPMAEFQIEARVLGRKPYSWGTEAQLSPLDLALGWGPMAQPEVLEKINIKQSGRFYRWSVDEFPVPRRDIEHNSANMHMIPANDQIRRTLQEVRENQIVRLRGYLVNVDNASGWRWRTSTTRTDTGSGACEIILVQLVETI